MMQIFLKFNTMLSGTMHSYLCRKCSTQVQKESTPSSTGCPKGGSHNWYRL